MNIFESIYQEFTSSSMWQNMLATHEDSPHHREANVAEHTRMTLDWYDSNLKSSRSIYQITLTKTALLFHDTGKPKARTEKFSEERGTYYSYPGHEKISARLFEDWYMSNVDNSPALQTLTWHDVRTIKFLIEHHLPYGIENKTKLYNLKYDLVRTNSSILQAFYDVLRSDAHGRISDDPETTYNRGNSWIEKFDNIVVQPKPAASTDNPLLQILIGPSGVGKSTYCNEVQEMYPEQDFVICSLDEYRMEFYTLKCGIENTYDACWQYCVDNESLFYKFLDQQFLKLVKDRRNILLDNTNTTAKKRRRWIAPAQQAGYTIVGIEFPTSLQMVLDRQNTRGDKCVPYSSVCAQYFALSTPLIGSEVDYLYVRSQDKNTFFM